MTITTGLNFELETCCNCGVVFAVQKDFQNRRREDQKWFYCPNGHPQSYTTSAKDAEIARLKKQAEDAEVRKRWAETDRDQAIRDRDQFKKKLTTTKGMLTRAKRRVGNGTCPCCGLGFPDLRGHMQEHHPEYKNPLPETEAADVRTTP